MASNNNIEHLTPPLCLDRKLNVMDKKVTSEQIEQLYIFTRKHFVEYYDLQTELVDHLANAIEETWQQQPQLSFEAALQLEFKKFGIFGFSDVVEKRQKAMFRRYYKLIWGYFKEFLRLPQIVITLLLTLIIYKILEFSPVCFTALFLITYTVFNTKQYFMRKDYKEKVKQNGRKWMMEELIYDCGSIGLVTYFFMEICWALLPDENLPFFVLFPLSAVAALLCLFDYVVFFVIPSKAKEHLKATYPEYGLEISA
jgi:hypothetical protein